MSAQEITPIAASQEGINTSQVTILPKQGGAGVISRTQAAKLESEQQRTRNAPTGKNMVPQNSIEPI